MFTLYIHCLEVLAMKAEGQTVKTIVEMGCEWTRQKVSAALYELEQEGYVTRDTSGKAHVWQIKEKACEYCERIARLYAQSHVMDDIADYVREQEKQPQEGAQDTITAISETTQDESASDGLSSQSDDEYDDCAYCGKKFLARASFDNFYCDQCYCAGYHLPLDNDFDMPEDESWDEGGDYSLDYCTLCNCPRSSCSCG